MTKPLVPSPLSVPELVDEYFIENRNRVIEVAAFLDRLDRSAPEGWTADFRMRVLKDAMALLLEGIPGGRVVQIQMLMSDPRTEPLSALDRKGAVGAYDGTKLAGGS